MELDDRRESVPFLIPDRDAKFARAILERFLGSARRECLDRLLIVGEGHLLHVLSLYVFHYNAHLSHRAPGLRAPDSVEIPPPNLQPALALANVQQRDLVGRRLHEYRAAA
ncbi:MAG: hypothetical protein M1274_01030 [Actinobacteria bacterium]|nr:hypothetical protein [Actinomycetota bacterium]